MRLLQFMFFSLGLPLILQGTASSNDCEILQKSEPIPNNVTTYSLLSQDSLSKQPTTIEVSAKNDKTLVLEGKNLSQGFSIVDNNSSQDGSKAILEAVIIKNFNIDYNLIKSISSILTYYENLNVLTIDSCSFELPSQLSDLYLNVKKLKIINSELDRDFLTHFETIDELSIYQSNLSLIDNPDAVNPIIKKLVVFNSDLSQSFLQFLNHTQKLEELIVKNCKLSFDSVQNVSFRIKRLEISYCSLPECFNHFLCNFSSLEEFIFDNCILPSPTFDEIFFDKIKKLEIVNCLHVENMLNTILSNSKDTLEELTIDHYYFHSHFAIQDGSSLKKLRTAKISYCALSEEILKNTLSLFPSSLQTLELSHLCDNNSTNDYLLFGYYFTLDFSNLNVHKRFPDLKDLTVTRNDITDFKFENFENLEGLEASDKLFKSFYLPPKMKIIVDNHTPKKISCCRSEVIRYTLSRFTNVLFSADGHFNVKASNSGISKTENNNFEHLKSVIFSDIKQTNNVAFIDHILSSFTGIPTITVNLHFKITEDQITASFNDFKTYDKIENVHFDVDSSSDISATCEFMIQILKRVPNLKSLSFKSSNEDVIGMLCNRLKEEKLEFPNLKKIDAEFGYGSINVLLWFIQTFDIEELSFKAFVLQCYSSESLNNFSSRKLNKLKIDSDLTFNSELLKQCFSNMKNLKELHLLCRPTLIGLFENNSTIEKVIFKYFDFESECTHPFSTLKTFKSLKSIYIRNSHPQYSYAPDHFKIYFKDRQVKLFFYTEDGYFQ